MKREFLENLGLEKDVIDQIMKENGNDINNTKATLTNVETERDNYKAQLEKANETLKGFADYDEVKSKVVDYQTQLESTQKEWENKFADLTFNTTLEKAILGSGAKNPKAIMGLLSDTIDTLKTSKNQETDIKTALDSIKADNDYLFNSNEPIKKAIAPTNGQGQASNPLDAMRAVMGLKTKEKGE